MAENSKYNTPEHRLWFCVLGLFASDIQRAQSALAIKCILNEARGRWTQFICNVTDIPHDTFLSGLARMGEKRLKEIIEKENKGGKVGDV